MEELRSTEALEREILEEARKKSERSLKEAEEELGRIADGAEAGLRRRLASLEADYGRRAAGIREEILAALPLELGRLRTDWADARLVGASGDYLAALPPPRMEALLGRRLSRAAELFRGSSCRLGYAGFSAERARALAEAALPGTELAELSEEAELPAPALLVETRDRRLRILASLELIRDELLDRGRGELATALCGRALRP